jgi:hypothetical protein
MYVHDLDVLYADLQRRGAVITQPPRVAPYGLREIEVEDLNGYRLTFGEIVPWRRPTIASKPLGRRGNTNRLSETRREGSMTGEKTYEYDLDVTGMTDYGITLPAILSGQASVPQRCAHRRRV